MPAFNNTNVKKDLREYEDGLFGKKIEIVKKEKICKFNDEYGVKLKNIEAQEDGWIIYNLHEGVIEDIVMSDEEYKEYKDA